MTIPRKGLENVTMVVFHQFHQPTRDVQLFKDTELESVYNKELSSEANNVYMGVIIAFPLLEHVMVHFVNNNSSR